MNLDWNSIRAINGSQRDGFEELVAQLANEETPANARFERVGTQDAGVECYCVFDDGSEWGWQAKYFTSALTNSQWGELDKSVKTALDKHPNLTRYYVCIPWDKPDARVPGRTSAKQKWDARVSKWRRWARERGMEVEFVWWGSFDLRKRLVQEEHVGMAFFWFQKQYFGGAWYDDHLSKAINAAGPRYTPPIHVDLPLARNLELFGRTKTALDTIKAIARDVKRGFGNIIPYGEERKELRETVDLSALSKSIAAILDAFSSLSQEPIGELPVADIVERVKAAIEESERVEESLEKLSRQHDSQQVDTDDSSPFRRNPYRNLLHRVGNLRYGLQEARNKLKRADDIANGKVMILKGDAGTGKTHLLCDVASSRVTEGAPTVLLLGQWFADSTEPWTQALQNLDMPRDTTAKQFVGALEASAHVANQRALLIIDAVNEGRGREIWWPHLSSFLSRIENSPWIGVILSVRSSYKKTVIPKNVREQAVVVNHTGFEGKENDAVRIFSEYYGIAFPSTPILRPEFQNPLFLKIIFEGLKDAGERIIPRGFFGVTETFNLYLTKVNEDLAETLNYDPKDNLVQVSLEKVAERMLDVDHDIRWLPRQEVKEVVNGLLAGRGFRDSLYHGLIVEGVLAEDMAWSAEGSYEVVRFAYERFSEHIIADSLLQKYLDLNNPRAAFAEGGALAFLPDKFDTPAGILEAMCVQVPERTGQELVRLAPSLMNEGWRIADAFLKSIVWRRPDAFSEDTLVVLDELGERASVNGDEIVNAILTVSTVPGHPLNANWLDAWLRRDAMPERDAWWSTYLHRAWRSGEGPIHRLIDWASDVSAGDDVENEVVDLAVIALAWMLTTSNRFLRDKATKALVCLLTNRLDATTRLVDRFDDVDDPYVKERIYAVAYGVAMRSHDASQVERLGRVVYENVFASGSPPPHIFLRDYARGVVERALHLNKNMGIDDELLHPPYGSDWPDIPEEEALEGLTPHLHDGKGKCGTTEWARNRIHLSIMEHDFARYVIDTVFTRWLALRLDEDTWESPHEQLLQRFNENELLAIEEYEDRKDEIQIQFMDEIRRLNGAPANADVDAVVTEITDDREKRLSCAREKFLTTLSEDNRLELERISEIPASPPGFDMSLAKRYILWRVFELGWTVERFGHFDSFDIGDSGRHEHKAERIGKKYQWIAYYEFLAFLADNYQFQPSLSEHNGVFQGVWQDSYPYRDIDPSCTLSATSGDTGWGSEHNSSSWWAKTDYTNWQEDASHQTWLETESDFPRIEGLLEVNRGDGQEKWIVSDSQYTWRQPHSADVDPYDTPRRDLRIACSGYFVRREDVNDFNKWIKSTDFSKRRMPESPNIYPSGMYLGEYGWSPASENFRKLHQSSQQAMIWSSTESGTSFAAQPAAIGYIAESNTFDGSIENSYSLRLPSADYVAGNALKWSGDGADLVNGQGDLVAFDPSVYEDGPGALLLRKDVLLDYLAREGLALCWEVVVEKMIVGDNHGRHEIPTQSGAYALTENGFEGCISRTGAM